MRVVIALGGNALLKRGQPPKAENQRANVCAAVGSLSEVLGDCEAVVTHGNGPQVGLLALQAESYGAVEPYPLDVLDAETEGMLGYLIQQELQNALPHRQVVALLTRVEVDPEDPAFGTPTKPIGPLYDEQRGRSVAAERSWTIAADGTGYRRVVASPKPQSILEIRTIELLLAQEHIVVCAGGGGIPVARVPEGGMQGVEAVVDKDRTAALLACQLKADRLLLLTDVPAVYADWTNPARKAIQTASPEQMQELTFDPGSMGPKVEAACEFVRSTQKPASIGATTDVAKILNEVSGTTIRPNPGPIRYYA